MSDEHQVSRVENFVSIPEEEEGSVGRPTYSPGYPQSTPNQPGVSNRQVVHGTDHPLPSNTAFHLPSSTPVVSSGVPRLPAPRSLFPAPLPDGTATTNSELRWPAVPGLLQGPSSPTTPHSPVAEEFSEDQEYPGSVPVAESEGIDTSNGVTGTNDDVNADNYNDHAQESSRNDAEESFISVHEKKVLDENRRRNDEMNCITCCFRKRDVAIIPCGHVAVCGICVAELNRTCPVCRVKIEETKRILLSTFNDRRTNESMVS